MKKTKDTNKGITLIALVITIIVMLILVAVTITMAVNGGLFGYASRAGTKTNAATDAEQEYANLQPNMTVNQLIDKYTGWTSGETKTITFVIDGVTYTAEEGMNWIQWIESPDYFSGDWGILGELVYRSWGEVFVVRMLPEGEELPSGVPFEYVFATSPIEDGFSYSSGC